MLLTSAALLATAESAHARLPGTPAAAPRKAPAKKPPGKPTQAKPKAPPHAAPANWHPPAPADVQPPRAVPLELALEKSTLPNGLRVVLNPDPGLPVVAVAVAYAAGSRHETQGQEDFASIAALAMGQAPFALPGAQHVRQLVDRGASLSTVATTDQIAFVSLVPAQALEFTLWLEAQRLLNGRVTQDALDTWRQRLRSRDQLSISLQHLAPVQARVEQLAFQGYFPYEHASAGAEALAEVKLQDVQDFLQSWYAPKNAVLAISGAFEPEQALTAVRRHFEALPRSANAAVFNPSPLPDQTNQRSAVIRSEQGQGPLLAYGWAVPAHRQPEHDALCMAVSILAEGPDSRIMQKLAKARLPVSLSVRLDERRGPSLLLLAAQGPQDASLLEARKLIDAELDALARLGPTTEEMRALWSDGQKRLLRSLEPADQRAARLAGLELLHGDARLVHAEQARVLSLTKDDVRKAVARFLSPTRRALVEANAAGRSLEPPAPARPAAQTAAHASAPRALPPQKPGAKKKPPPAKPPAKKKKKK